MRRIYYPWRAPDSSKEMESNFAIVRNTHGYTSAKDISES